MSPPESQKPALEKKTDAGRSETSNFLAVNTLHYHANDLSELRKLAQQNPEIAMKVIEQRDRESARVAASYTTGLIIAGALLAVIIVTLGCLAMFAGVLKTLLVIVGILSAALLTRVVLTGDWSETSWLGRMIEVVARHLGSRG